MTARENMAAYMANRHRQQRARAIALRGGKCVDCGTDQFLEFDHRDPKEKVFTISAKFTRSWERLVEEIQKCDLRCNPCHIKRSAEQQSVKHGEGLMGKRNCRCELCAPLKRAYLNKFRRPL